jgi:hypothetical protein
MNWSNCTTSLYVDGEGVIEILLGLGVAAAPPLLRALDLQGAERLSSSPRHHDRPEEEKQHETAATGNLPTNYQSWTPWHASPLATMVGQRIPTSVFTLPQDLAT